MALYYYPPVIVNGTLASTDDMQIYVRGKILQTLSIVRGELVATPFFGVPIKIFSSITDVEDDSARVERILKDEIPEADFVVNTELSNDGLFVLNVYWTFLGNKNLEQFEVVV